MKLSRTHADTNWLVAMFFTQPGLMAARNKIVSQYLRHHSGQMLVTAIAGIEVENVFRHESGESDPAELNEFKTDPRFYREPMNWHALARETESIFRRYAHKSRIGTFDVTLLASAKLDGATHLLSFDEKFKAMAVAEGIEVFPPLNDEGRAHLAELK